MPRPNRPIPDEVGRRAQELVTKTEDGCWISTYAPTTQGYAQITQTIAGKPITFMAHRASWSLENGPIPDGDVIDHKCFNRLCVNPDHLRLLSLFENAQRQRGQDFPLGQCRWGHDLSHMRGVEWESRKGRRVCGQCLKERNDYIVALRKNLRLLEITYGLGDWHTKRSYPRALAEREARVAARRAERTSTDAGEANHG